MMHVDNVKSTGNAVQPAKAQISPAAEQANTVADSVSKNIQSKIMDAQKQRQGLSFNMEMTAEEKENVRRKIQQEISDLKRELRQREAEEKKKQQETQRAVEKKEQQQDKESQEAARKQQIQTTQDENNQQQKVQPTRDEKEQQQNTAVTRTSKQTEDSTADGEVREILPGGMHKIISTNSSVQKYQIVKNAVAQNDSAARVQEAEMNQDAVRGAETDSLKKDQLEAVQKETQRMETVQNFIFGNSNNRAAESLIGTGNHFSSNARESGLYSNNGMLFQNYFQSIQMDVRQ